MATNTDGGTINSFNNTPQAVNDYETAWEDYSFCFDVMANDLGGKAKILWSVDDSSTDSNGDGTADLLTRDGTAAACPDYSDYGARVWIENGVVKYDTNALDWLAVGQTVCDKFTYAIRMSNGTLSWATVYVTLSGRNDAPVISEIATDSDSVTLPETNAPLGSSGTLTVRDVDTLDTVDTAVSSVSVTGATGGLTEAQLLGMMQIVAGANDIAADSGDTSNIGWAFDSTPAAFDYLAVGESLVLAYTITSTDNNGLSDTHIVTVTITGANDAPVISIVSGDSDSAAITETDSALSASGTLTVTDVDTSDEVDVVVSTVAVGGTGGDGGLGNAALLGMLSLTGNVDNAADGSAGSLVWSFDSDGEAFDYLAAGETLVLTYTLTASDGNGGSDTQTVTVTITGSNDAPVLTVDPTGGVTEDVGVILGLISTSGSVSVTDADATDVVTIGAVYNSDAEWSDGSLTPAQVAALGSGFNASSSGWNYAVSNALVGFLAAGETITLSFTVTATDDSGAANNSDSEIVTITITGTNDAPVIYVGALDEDAAGIAETNSGLTASGTLSLTDPDTSDEVDVSVTGVAVSGTGGDGGISNDDLKAMLGLTGNVDNAADGTAGSLGWSFDSDGQAFDYLAVGETLILTYTLTASDGNGGSDTQTVTITITGTNDAPVVASAIADQHVDEDAAWSFAFPAGTFSDVDGDTLTYAATLANGDPLPSWLSFNAATRTFSGTPPEDFYGTIALKVTASDGNGGSVSDTFDLIVDPVNDAPEAGPVTLAAIAEDSGARIITEAELLANSTDVDEDDLTVTAVSIAGGSGGSLVDNGNGTWTYTPALDDDSSVTFNFTISDGNGGSDSSTATMDITPVADFVYTSPAVFTGTGDPNDFDSLGNAAGQNLSSTATNGSDTIWGGAGADTINGGGGNDTLFGGSGGDGLGGNADLDTLYGGSGNDTINGGNDADRIIGGYGADTLTGGNGNDTFVYLSQKDTGDRITDFTQGEDHIEFAAAFGFDATDFLGALTTAGAVDPGKFGYKYDAGTNTTIVYVDTDGVFGADMEIKLTGNIGLTSGDFLFGS